MATGDVDLAQRMLGILPDIAADAEAAAPDDIAETVETWLAPLPLIIAALENIDVSDPDAFEQAVSAIQTGNSDTARGEVSAWAEFNCGWTSSLDTEVVAAPEPPDCEELDAAAAAEAAEIDVDVSDLDGTGDLNVPGFWTKSCSYGNGAMSLSTMSFNAVEDAEQFYADNLDVAAAVVLDTDTGSLPESSLVIETGVAVDSSVPTSEESAGSVAPSVQVVVFDAAIPFSVTVTGDDVDPAAVVAAAEAVLATQSGAPTTSSVP